MQNVRSSGSRSQSIGTIDNNGNATTLTNRHRGMNMWRSTSLINLVNHGRKKSSVYESTPLIDKIRSDRSNDDKKAKIKNGWSTIVNIVLVKARGLPAHPDDGSLHNLHCKIKLGSETLKSKSVPNTPQPEWRERFKLHLHKDYLLRISLWDKGKQKNFMGSCVLDLSSLGMECTHEIWQNLDDGYGSIHLTVTMCTIRNRDSTPNNDAQIISEDIQEKYGLLNFGEDWKVVGKILVKIISAKGLQGSNVYCALELDNERVQTPSARGSEPEWNKSYLFNIYDITSTFDLKVYDDSLVNMIRSECLGEVSIPLLRVRNGETWWYALKDKHKRKIAKGNCPRVQLEMSIVWNPIKATLRLFQPKEVKHIKKPTKFDIALLYKNVEFMRDTFEFLLEINESFKRLFEWDDRQLSFIVLSVWVIFCYCVKIWTIPLLCLIPFFYFWMYNLTHKEQLFMRHYGSIENIEYVNISSRPSLIRLSERVNKLPEMTIIITNGIEYIVSLAEKIYNLASFKIPFLSYLTIILLIITSVALYFIPFNYLLMTLGIYKFTRKYLNPERELNNDIIDFFSRLPDNELLKDWKELSVPEPTQTRYTSIGSLSTSGS